MSLILDALKKLDREKSTGRNRPGNLALDILKPDLSLPPKRIPLYLGAFLIIVVGTAAITYAVLSGFGFRSGPSTPAPVNFPQPAQLAASNSGDSLSPLKSPPLASLPPVSLSLPGPSPQVTPAPSESIPPSKAFPGPPAMAPTPRQPEAPAPVESVSPPKSGPPPPASPPVSVQQVPPAPLPREPVRDAREKISGTSSKVEAAPESRPPLPAPVEEKPSRSIIPERPVVAPEMTRKTQDPPPSVSATDPPVMKLSGILWHEDPLERRAVINGMVLREGTSIEGIRVLEIHPTHVRLSHKGRPIDIFMFR